MCGIVGVIRFDQQPVNPVTIRAMTEVQHHRGPDDQAFCFFDLKTAKYLFFKEENPSGELPLYRGALGFNRLSILDTSERGRQPMSSSDGKVHIVFNGEIYNSPDLRASLEKRGASFRSRSDTEVILQWYQTHGWESLLQNLNGMFAFCLLDLQIGAAYLARDRVGIKPLYMATVPEGLLFSSEAKSFLKYPGFRFRLDQTKLDEYLIFRYVAGAETLIHDVVQLPPGTWVKIDQRVSSPQRYWTWPSYSSAPEVDGRDFEDSLKKSIQLQLLSDVKLGCQLSGGVDSGLVNLYAAQAAGTQLDAVSVILEDPAFSEEPWIDQVVRKSGIRAHKYLMQSRWFAENLKRASWHLDQPLNHPNSLGILYLAQHAKSSVTVLLSGEGADELLAGYPRFYYQSLALKHSNLVGLISAIPKFGTTARKKFCLSRASQADRCIFSTTRLSDDQAAWVYPQFDLERALGKRRAMFDEVCGESFLQRFLNYEMSTYLQEMLLRQDKMTMAVGVENRVPFLDHELIERVRRLPDRELVTFRVHLGKNVIERNTKVVLKKLAAREFGSKFAYRKKSGFAIPLREVILEKCFSELVQDELLPSIRKRELFNVEYLQSIWERRQEIESAELELLWVTFAFELWAGQFENTQFGD